MNDQDRDELIARNPAWVKRGREISPELRDAFRATYWARQDLQDEEAWIFEVRLPIFGLLAELIAEDDLQELRDGFGLGVATARLRNEDFQDPDQGTSKIPDPKIFSNERIKAERDNLWQLSEEITEYVRRQYNKGKHYDQFVLYLLIDW